MPVLSRAVAAPVEPPGPLPVRVLPASLRAAFSVPQLRGAFDDRPHDQHRDPDLQPLRRLDARRGMNRRIAPSILAADFGRLREQVRDVLDAGASVIHVDVMDGHFVPPITMGPIAVQALRELGAHLDYTLEHIRSAGCRAGLAVCPSTPLGVYAEVELDQALCMTVNPGWGGQEFIPRSVDRIAPRRPRVGAAVDL